jgi:hypothetical protein
VCVDRDALTAVLVAGLLTSNAAEAATIGCQSLPGDAKLEILERNSSIFSFIRIIKIRVSSPTNPSPLIGFTVETGPANGAVNFISPQ